MITIVVADDHKMFRQGVISLLTGEKEFNIIGEASNGIEVISLVENLKPDILLLDIEMPKMDGFDTLRALKKIKTETKILILTSYKSAEFIKNSIKAGASGYLQKDAGKKLLITAIKEVKAIGYFYPKGINDIVLNSFKDNYQASQISKREKEIITLIANGLTTKSIASKLYISPYTVETHRQNILLKLGLKNSAELVKYAIQKGIL